MQLRGRFLVWTLPLWILILGIPSAAVQQPAQALKPAVTLEDLAWLAGAWVKEDDQSRSEEHWMQPRGGSMVGMNRMVMKGTTADGQKRERMLFFEFLRIEHAPSGGGIVYLASPNGRTPPTPFMLVESSPNLARFENPQHDFPTRIIYERKGDELTARIEGTQNSQPASESWTWKRQREGK